MTYDPEDGAREDWYEETVRELYPGILEAALAGANTDRLRRYYLEYPLVMRPATGALQRASRLLDEGHATASIVFSGTAMELYLKATLLNPVVYGLADIGNLAERLCAMLIRNLRFNRYCELLEPVFDYLTGQELKAIRRIGAETELLTECKELWSRRNGIIHRGDICGLNDAVRAIEVASGVCLHIVAPSLHKLAVVIDNESGDLRVL